uniref:BRCT domain-containing protein n=1 Tax=Schistocephalus solidus TaxID=70667 RepID=A0A183SV21_SCHSO
LHPQQQHQTATATVVTQNQHLQLQQGHPLRPAGIPHQKVMGTALPLQATGPGFGQLVNAQHMALADPIQRQQTQLLTAGGQRQLDHALLSQQQQHLQRAQRLPLQNQSWQQVVPQGLQMQQACRGAAVTPQRQPAVPPRTMTVSAAVPGGQPRSQNTPQTAAVSLFQFPSYVGHVGEFSPSTTEDCLVGCVFLLLGYHSFGETQKALWKRIMRSYGAEIVLTYEPSRVTHVVVDWQLEEPELFKQSDRSLQIRSNPELVTAASLDPKGPEAPLHDSLSECVSYPTYMCTDISSEATLLPTADDYSSTTFLQPVASPCSLSLSSSGTPTSISPTSDFSLFSLSLHVSSTKDAVTQCEFDTETKLEPHGIKGLPSVRNIVSVDPVKMEASIGSQKPAEELLKQRTGEVQKIERKDKVRNPSIGLRSGFSRDSGPSSKTKTTGKTELLCVHRLTPQPLSGFSQNNRLQTKEFSSVSRPKMRPQFRQLLLFRSNPSVTRRFVIRDKQCLQLLEGLAHDGSCKDRRLFCTLNNYAGARAELVASKPPDSYGRLTYFLYLHARTWDQMRWIVRDIDRYYPQWALSAQLTQ